MKVGEGRQRPKKMCSKGREKMEEGLSEMRWEERGELGSKGGGEGRW